MRYPFLLAARFLTVSLLLAVGLSANGCGDTATVNPVVELASLTVSPGTLQPAFDRSTTQYRADLTSDITNVTITAQPAVAGDSIAINGQTTTSRAIALEPPGSTTIVNVVVSETNTNSRTYVIRLIRAGLAGNNSLQNLVVSPGTLAPTFDPNLQVYTASVANNTGSVAVTPTLSDPAATMTVNGQPAISGQAQTVSLSGGGENTVITIAVTAQNEAVKTYQVTVSRGRSNNNNLQSLGISPGTLSPAFRAGTTGYTVNLPATLASNVTSIRVTPTLQDDTATMTVNGQATTSGQTQTAPLPTPGSNNFINIVVVAQDGTPKTYSVNVIRAALGGNNNLQSLTVSPTGLNPSFTASTTSYTLGVGSGVSSVTVTPRPQDTAATITVTSNGPGPVTTSGQARTIPLRDAGLSTTINIVVRAPNGSEKPYTITVDRATPPPPSGNNNLQNLTVSPGSLSPAFSTTRARTDYVVNDVTSSATSITVIATLQDPSASVTINGQGGNSRPIPLPGGPSSTEIEVRVIAPNGTPKTYSITVNQPAPAAPAAPTIAPDLLTEDDSCPLLEPPDPTNPDPDGCVPGTSKSDNITNVNTPRFRIAPPAAGQTPNLYVDGARVDSTFNLTASTLQPTTALSDGEHRITYTVTNAGGESGPSPSLTVTINTGAPGAPTS